MRVTQNMMMDTILRNISANLERLERVQSELSSGKQIRQPSDDPIGTATVLRLQSSQAQITQYLKNVDEAQSWLDLTDQALSTIGDAVQRARELIVQAANDTLSAADRQAIWNELTALQQQIVATANTAHAGQYLFSGQKTQTAPFDATTDPPTYQGDNGALTRIIDSGVTLTINVPGNVAITPMLQAIKQARDAVAANDTAAIQTSLGVLDNAHSQLLAAQAQIGAQANRLDAQRNRLLEAQTSTLRLLSQAQDADMAQASVEFAEAQLTYRAALQAAAQAIQPTLADYLR
ncbi:flagellar hook-associated protein FlgL [Thermorudis peleae]|uniref:flagellar hook-associated protein FlgL n=1 Tax=Thermorudis peleae TaxID=1382356 RepID=UPI00056E74E8|nr:flagellar hook-associated protein FlgL [Thermorudis peleae]